MKNVLLLIDIQNDYFDNGTMPLVGSDLACQNAKTILDFFRLNDLPVIHIQHIAIRRDATFFLHNTKGAEIHKLVKPLIHEKVIVKHFPNSFIRTELLDHLKSLNTKKLVICGMMTHMCVDSTVRAAKDAGFDCTLIGDACATRDLTINGQTVKAQEVHNSFLAALNFFYANVLSLHQFSVES